MNRDITIIGAPSSIGIRPYADGAPRRLDLTPGVLRESGLAARLKARDAGDVLPPPRYQDIKRPEGRRPAGGGFPNRCSRSPAVDLR